MKLKPEYRKLLEIYPDLENQIKAKPIDSSGFVDVFNVVTEYYDRVWIAPDMIYVYRRYKAVDPLVKILCQNPDFNKAFQEACEYQWSNDLEHIKVEYPIGTYNADYSRRNYIRIYKEDVKEEFV